MDRALKRKIKRRVRKAVANPAVHQARVYSTDKRNVYEYKVVHHVRSIFVKKTWYGRLRFL